MFGLEKSGWTSIALLLIQRCPGQSRSRLEIVFDAKTPGITASGKTRSKRRGFSLRDGVGLRIIQKTTTGPSALCYRRRRLCKLSIRQGQRPQERHALLRRRIC